MMCGLREVPALQLVGHLFLLATITFIFYLFILGRNRANPTKKANQLPSPPKLPLLGNFHQLGSLPHRSLRALSEKYGPLILLHFGRLPTLIVSSAEMAQEVMKTHDLVFANRPPSSLAKKLFYDSQDVAFSPYGEYWRQVRRICVLHLLSLKMVHSFRWVRQEEVALLIEKIRVSSGPVNMSELLITLTNDIVFRVALGKRYSSAEEGGSDTHRKIFTDISALLGEFPIGDFIPCLSWVDALSGLNARVRRSFLELDAFMDTVLEDQQQAKKISHGGHVDSASINFVHVLLSLDDMDDSASISLSRDNIKAIILVPSLSLSLGGKYANIELTCVLQDMLSGGTDTTFTVLEWTMAELIKHPEAMKRVQEEVRTVARNKGNVEEEDTDQLSYLKAVIKESLRLHPPAPLLVPHESVEDVKLQSYDIPARTRILINAWAIGRDPSSWERPEEFWPDRFINSSVDFKGQDFQLIPFGAGRRGCPGIGFAIPTIELALANLLHYFDWVLPEGRDGGQLDLTETSGIVTHMKSNLVLVAKPVQ